MAQRKLQAEIDKTLKRVHEGVQVFEDMYDKFMLSTNATQKDKLETDLKTQIKKLQRMRDQVKSWQTSNDIKDKGPLDQTRRVIETKMELFKALEKETKTKAFSKEGLILATRLDPAEKAKQEARAQLEEFVDALNRQIEGCEAEIETLQAATGGRKKKGKDANGAGGRAEELERSNERRRWHIGNLEASMRALENGRVTADQVAEIKEDVAYFVESNEEEDFEEDEGIYDELHLEEEDDNIGLLASHDGVSNVGGNDDFSESDMQSVVDDHPPKPTPSKASRSVSEDPMPAPTSPLQVRKAPVRKTTDKEKVKEETTATTTPSKPTRTVSEKSVPAASVLSPAAPRQSTAPALPPIKYAAAAAAAVQASAPVVPPPPKETVTSPPVEQVVSPIAMPPTPEMAPPPPPGLSQAPPAQTPPPAQLAPPPSAPVSPHQVKASPAPSVSTLNVGMASVSLAASPVQSPSNGHNVPNVISPQPPVAQPQPQVPPPNLAQQAIPAVQSVSSQIQQSRQQQQIQVQNGAQEVGFPAAQQQQQPPAMAHAPSALSDLMTRFDEVRKNSPARLADVDGLTAALDVGLATAPGARDASRPNYYRPKNPYPTPDYYPQKPHASMVDQHLAQKMSKMELDTLFFIFYYKPNTYEQWLAARELRQRSWRFHKQYLTWFQRYSQPQAITDDYEQGQYTYFDWEGRWTFLRKADFRFMYAYLSDE
ncbi:general negative regulator of transcription subunit 5 [Naganishia albida]|nr:general negative regulator of transcription subunit 5 [Naganishia albida]